MKTTLYLVRQDAAEADPTGPARLHGPRHDLTRLGVRQAQLTRDFLAVRPIDACYSGPAARAVETARILAEPHGLTPCILEDLGDGVLGDPDWQTVHYLDYQGVRRGVALPSAAGESFARLQRRVADALEGLLERHAGRSVLVVAHRLTHLSYLGRVLDLTAEQAGQVQLDNCGVSVVVRQGGRTAVTTLNASFHLHGAA
jgi:broad specificity phosphatase PhoE